VGLLEGKIAVVTGAGRGIGRAHAMALAEEGAAVLINDVGRDLKGGEGGKGLEASQSTPAVAQAVVDEIVANGGRALADATDVGNIEAAASVVATAIDAFGRIDILVNNAGTFIESTIFDVDDERFNAEFATHVKGTIGTTRAAVTAMREAGHGGRIINTISGFGGTGTLALYLAAKSAVASYTLATANDGAPYGITANAIQPLAITRQSRKWFVDSGALDPNDQATIAHIGPHINTPVVVYLASSLAADVTGKFFSVTPEEFSPSAPIRIREVYLDMTRRSSGGGVVSHRGRGLRIADTPLAVLTRSRGSGR
jgi:NAD(P)-dependent dehydrogenase (short-subunit alcohol dehydrogenase family)